jgi:hypothetical protein
MKMKAFGTHFNRLTEAAFFGAIFQLQYPPRTYRCAYPAAYTAATDDVLPTLGIPAYIDTHFAIGGAIATGDALPSIGSDAESGFETLHQAQIRRKWAAETAPYPIAHKGIKTRAYHAGENRTNKEPIALTQVLRA